MTTTVLRLIAFAFVSTVLIPVCGRAADYPPPQSGDWVAHDFKFHTGETMPEVHIHYTTIGAPTGEPVLVLHGTAGTGEGMLSPAFAGELFGPGQILDASKYYIILPDAIGHGKSSKPSDGMHARFPRYDYDDMVAAQYRLVTEGLGIRHLRSVIGFSMGGMQTWLWGEHYPGFMDTLVPMAATPSAMSGRNWMTRRLFVDSIRNDPNWKGGDYTEQPTAFKAMWVYFGITTVGGSAELYKLAPTSALADKVVDDRMAAPFKADANDTLYQWQSSDDFDPSAEVDRITAATLAINSSDDPRNPPELGLMEPALKRMKNAHLYLIPGSPDTKGHITVLWANYWKAQLEELLAKTPH